MAPSINDTHCEGAGLLSSTRPWSRLYQRFRQFEGFGLDSTMSMNMLRAPPPRVDLHGKNVLISGGNSGIGLEAAFTFALWGARVVLACRAESPPHELSAAEAREQIVERGAGAIEPDQVEVWELDLSRFASVTACAERWLATGWTLDYLCNNAGLSSTKFIKTEDGFELTRSVNYLGHCLLTLIILPAMKGARAPRIVNTCSCFHHQGKLDFANLEYEKSAGQDRGPGGVQAYCDTKLQHLMWTKELQERLSYSDEYRHVVVNGVHPGFVGSNIWNGPGIKELTWPQPQLLSFLISSLSVSTEQGSLCILHGALNPAYGLRPSTLDAASANDKEASTASKTLDKGTSAAHGGFYISRDRTEDTPRPECFDRLARGRLWLRTLEDVKAKDRGLATDLPQNPLGVYS